jgi:hypothetical protein
MATAAAVRDLIREPVPGGDVDPVRGFVGRPRGHVARADGPACRAKTAGAA